MIIITDNGRDLLGVIDNDREALIIRSPSGGR